jgi:hypothetical protein
MELNCSIGVPLVDGVCLSVSLKAVLLLILYWLGSSKSCQNLLSDKVKTFGKWRYGSTVLDLSTRWKWVVATLPLDRMLGGSQIRSACYGAGAPAGNWNQAVQPVACHYTNRDVRTRTYH